MCAIDSQRLLQQAHDKSLFVELSFIQIISGSIISYCLLPVSFSGSRRPQPTLSHSLLARPTLKHVACDHVAFFGPTFFHFLGMFATNISYGVLGSTFTFVIKMSEPAFTIVLKRLILRQTTSFRSACGVMITLLGIFLIGFQDNGVKRSSFFPFFISSCTFPLRNILVKKNDMKASESRSTTMHLFLLNTQAVPLASLTLACKYAVTGRLFLLDSPAVALALFKIATAYNLYHYASLFLLRKVDAVSHSLANSAKRVCGVYISAMLLGEHLSARIVAASTVLCAGVLLHAVETPPASGSSKLQSSFLRFSVTFALASFSLLAGFAVTTFKGEFLASVPTKSPLLAEKSATVSQMDRLVVIHKPYKPVRAFLSSYRDAFTLIHEKKVNGNSGNLVWHLAASLLLDTSNLRHCVEPCYQPALQGALENNTVVYWPTANFLELAHDDEAAKISQDKKKYVVIGLGTQSFFYQNVSDDTLRGIHPGLMPNVAGKDYALSSGCLSFLRKLSTDGFPVFLRGDFTRNVLERHGIFSGRSAGCPSLFLNTRHDMGARLEENYENLRNGGHHSIRKVGITINRSPSVLEFAMKIYEMYPESVFFAQTELDLRMLQNRGVPFERTRIFYSVEDWQASICNFELSVGVRIHGAMAALSCDDPVPVLLIAPDERVKELAEVMMIPHVSSYNRALSNFSGNLMDILPLFQISGLAFDVNRCLIARSYKNTFEAAGLRINSAVANIARIC